MRAHRDNGEQNERILQEILSRQNDHTSIKVSKSTPTGLELRSATALRHEWSTVLTDDWRALLGCDWRWTMSQNDFQRAYEFYARFPILTLSGRMAFTLSFSFRRLVGYVPNISVLGGGLNFVNIVSTDAEVVRACERGDTFTVRNLFLEKKAAPNDMSDEDRTLIFVRIFRKPILSTLMMVEYAAQSGSIELVQFLIDAGAPVQPLVHVRLYKQEIVTNTCDRRQLLAAAYFRQPEIARMLLRTKRADVETLAPAGYTTASYLYGNSRPKTSQAEFLAVLASHSFSYFNAQDEKGWTVLHRAAAWGTAADIKALMLLEVIITCTSRLGWSPLFCAAGNRNLETLEALWEILDKEPNADLHESKDLRGWNLLHVAAGYGNYEAVSFLLERGVSLDAVSTATFRSVPPSTRGKCVTPSQVARSCGEESYTKWTEQVSAAGSTVGVRPEDIDWTQEETSELGVCECCDNWNV